MGITITPASNCNQYVVDYCEWDEEEGYVEKNVVLTPDELGEFLLQIIPYKPTGKKKSTLTVVK